MQPSKKLILVVIDALAPEALDRAVAKGTVPILAEAIQRGHYSRECSSVFPSVTPVCAATIGTGVLPHQHRIPAMNWYNRAHSRYVEYGSSFSASRAMGISRSLTDTVYNLNLSHLSPTVETIFESLDDTGKVRTAGTTYLIIRGRHRHEPARDSSIVRIATSTLFRHAVYGPRELFYADLFSSRQTGYSAQLGNPGARDAHSGGVGSYMAEHDLYDFMLLSLPDNDTYSHRHGPAAQVDSVAIADQQIARIAEASGGVERFFEQNALIVLADHAQSEVKNTFELVNLLDDFGVLPIDQEANQRQPKARLAVCPNARAGAVYLLDQERDFRLLEDVQSRLLNHPAVDLTCSVKDGTFTVKRDGGELRFWPGNQSFDLRGNEWVIEGDLAVLDLQIDARIVTSERYPNALERIYSSLSSPTSPQLWISLSDGFECVDWGGSNHLGGGSHGSLSRTDSLAPLIYCGLNFQPPPESHPWSIVDPASLVRRHFGCF